MHPTEAAPVRIGLKRATLAKFDGNVSPGAEPLVMITGNDERMALLMRPLDLSKLTRDEVDQLTALATKAQFPQGADLPAWDETLAHSRK